MSLGVVSNCGAGHPDGELLAADTAGRSVTPADVTGDPENSAAFDSATPRPMTERNVITTMNGVAVT